MHLRIENPFPIALPPIVKAAIKAVITKLVINGFKLKVDVNVAATITPAEPETIPQISPIITQDKLHYS